MNKITTVVAACLSTLAVATSAFAAETWGAGGAIENTKKFSQETHTAWCGYNGTLPAQQTYQQEGLVINNQIGSNGACGNNSTASNWIATQSQNAGGCSSVTPTDTNKKACHALYSTFLNKTAPFKQ